MTRRASRTPTASVDSFRDDPLYPRIERAAGAILAKGKVVAPVEVLIGMRLLRPAQVDDWRRGRVPYLEGVIDCNLTRLSRRLRILRFHAHHLKLVPSMTIYMRWGKGPERRLRFTKKRRGEARGSLCEALRLARQGSFPPARCQARMNRRVPDLEKLRAELRRLRRGDLLIIVERALELVPSAKPKALLGGFVPIEPLAATESGAVSLLDEVRKFHAENSLLAGGYDRHAARREVAGQVRSVLDSWQRSSGEEGSPAVARLPRAP